MSTMVPVVKVAAVLIGAALVLALFVSSSTEHTPGPAPAPRRVATALEPGPLRVPTGAAAAPVSAAWQADRSGYAISLVTGPTMGADAAREDAFDQLYRRIREAVFKIARSHGWVDDERRAEFDAVLRDRYPRDVAINLGEAVLRPTEEDLGAGIVHHGNDVRWRADRFTLEATAEGVAKTVAMRHREPWLKLGIGLAVVILGMVGWLRLDWWLKGHYGILTGLLVAAGVLIALGLIWSVDLRV